MAKRPRSWLCVSFKIARPAASHQVGGCDEEVPWCITLDNSKGISRLRFWAKNSRVNGINDLPIFMHQGNALAESIIGLYKTEVIRRRGPWRGLEDVEFATLEWVHWYNTQRLLEPIGNVSPVEYEMNYYRSQEGSLEMARLN